MAYYGRNPEIRKSIDEMLDRYAEGVLTDEDLKRLSDWEVVKHATTAQLARFERSFSRRGQTPMPLIATFLKAFRVRFEQSAKLRGPAGLDDAAARAATVEVAVAAELIELETEGSDEAEPVEADDIKQR